MADENDTPAVDQIIGTARVSFRQVLSLVESFYDRAVEIYDPYDDALSPSLDLWAKVREI